MAFIFPNVIRLCLQNDPNLFNNRALRMALFYNAPLFSTNDPRYVDEIENVQTLTDLVGWTEVTVAGYPLVETEIVDDYVSGSSTMVLLSQWPIPDSLAPVQVRAIAFFIPGTVGGIADDPIVMITNTPFSPVATLVGGDLIAPIPDENSNRWLFAWNNANPSESLQEGTLAIQKAPPEFEPAHTQHAWMYPQRVNVIANPSFELGVNHWRANGSVHRVDVVIPDGGYKAGMFTRGSSPLIVESNKFPGRISNDWTVRLLAKGNGTLKVGLLAWPVEYGETDVDWGGDEEWELSPDSYLAITALRSVPEIYEGQIRLELDGTELTIDQVIAEPGFLLDWDYFDGDTTYGARDDFSWYGGENLKGKTYSLWYNNKRATAGRLFATKFPDRAASTSLDELKEGLVYQWVPAGTLIEPHWDVLFEGDLQHPVPDIAGTPITPYRTTTPGTPEYSLDMGVDSPWGSAPEPPEPPTLTYAEVTLTDSPVAFWPLDDASPVDTIAARNITWNGSPGTGVAGPSAAIPKCTHFSGGAVFGKTTATATQLNPAGDMSWECWVSRWNQPPGNASIVSCGTSGNPSTWGFDAPSPTGGWSAYMTSNNGGGTYLRVTDPTAIGNTGAWRHLVATLSGTTLKLYVNGVEVASSNTPSGTRDANGVARNVFISKYNDNYTQYVPADVAALALYGSALSPARVLAHYNAGIA